MRHVACMGYKKCIPNFDLQVWRTEIICKP